MSVKGFQVGNNVEKYDYDELLNKPTIPTKTSDLTNDSDFLPVLGASSARDGDVVVYDGSNSRWIVDAPPSIPSTAADVGAIAAPSSPATGAFLVWSGSAWVAQTLSTWQGGSY